MKFGIFEHMDDSGTPVGRHFENRLSLIEAYDRYGFYAYHLAEHHGTPLGLAPSPWKNFARSDDQLPLMGISRHIVLADTEAEAIRIAERAYRIWLKHMELLWNRNGMKLPLGLPPDIGPLLQARSAFAGTVAGFRNFLKDQIEATDASYFVCDVAFGDLTPEELMRTTRLLASTARLPRSGRCGAMLSRATTAAQ